MERIQTLVVRNEKFEVVKFEGMYCAINHKYLDENMCLTRSLNGLQMHANTDLQECLNTAKDSAEIDYLMSQGMTLEDAIGEYYTR